MHYFPCMLSVSVWLCMLHSLLRMDQHMYKIGYCRVTHLSAQVGELPWSAIESGLICIARLSSHLGGWMREVRTVTGETAPIRGKGKVKLKIVSAKMTQDIWIADIQDECILGLDFLEPQGCMVNLREGTLLIGEEEIALEKSADTQAGKCCRAVLEASVQIDLKTPPPSPHLLCLPFPRTCWWLCLRTVQGVLTWWGLGEGGAIPLVTLRWQHSPNYMYIHPHICQKCVHTTHWSWIVVMTRPCWYC